MRILHTRIRVREIERSVAFYRDVLGLEQRGRQVSPRGNELVFLRDPASGHEIELCRQPGDQDFAFPEDIFHICFEVDDLERLGRELAARGIGFSDGPQRAGSGAMLAFIDDPDGYELELLQPAGR